MELTIKDLMKFYCCSEKTAKARKREILLSVGIVNIKRRPLVIHLAQYERLSIDIVKTTILE
jgi:hypothetical protein